jgi:hypothetical protein
VPFYEHAIDDFPHTGGYGDLQKSDYIPTAAIIPNA